MSIEDSLIRRQIFNQRFANGLSDEMVETLERINADIEARMLRDLTEFQTERFALMQRDINNILNLGYSGFSDELIEGLNGFTRSDLDFSYRALGFDTDVILGMPILDQVQLHVLSSEMGVGSGVGLLSMSEAIEQFGIKKSAEILTAINDGILIGETNAQIVKRIQDLTLRTKHQVRTLVRTAVSKASGVAMEDIARQNAEILKGMEWVATLDSRTTLICAGRDGRVYPIGKTPPFPAHWGERSRLVPVLKDEFNIDNSAVRRPEVGDDGAGTTSGSTKFNSWLKRQDAAFQDEYFSKFPNGLEKAALFRRGGLDIQQFRDEIGHNYTLEQLASLEPLAFQKANIIYI